MEPERVFDLYWSPEGRRIARVVATAESKAIRKAPKPYKKYLGEIYAEGVIWLIPPVRLPKTKELIMSKERNVTFGVTYNDPDKEELSYQSIDVKFTGEIEPNVLLSEAITAIQQRLYDAVNGKILTTTLRRQP